MALVVMVPVIQAEILIVPCVVLIKEVAAREAQNAVIPATALVKKIIQLGIAEIVHTPQAGAFRRKLEITYFELFIDTAARNKSAYSFTVLYQRSEVPVLRIVSVREGMRRTVRVRECFTGGHMPGKAVDPAHHEMVEEEFPEPYSPAPPVLPGFCHDDVRIIPLLLFAASLTGERLQAEFPHVCVTYGIHRFSADVVLCVIYPEKWK